MAYPGTGMWDSAMRTALRRSPKGLGVTVTDGEVTLPGTTSLGYTEGDTTVKIKAAIEVTDAGDGSGSVATLTLTGRPTTDPGERGARRTGRRRRT